MHDAHRGPMKRLLERLARHGDRVYIAVHDELRGVIDVDSSVFNVVLNYWFVSRPMEGQTCNAVGCTGERSAPRRNTKWTCGSPALPSTGAAWLSLDIVTEHSASV